METEEQRRARQDGAQLAFSMVLREIVVHAFPEKERAIRRDLLCEAIEAFYDEPTLKHEGHSALQVALAAIEEIFAPTQPVRTPRGHTRNG